MPRILSIVLPTIVLMLAAAPIVVAKAPPCAKTEMAIADERGGGRKICLKKSEWEKARRICAKSTKKGEKVDPMGCICQDGSTVGACGD